MSMEEKLGVFKDMGLDGVYICDFEKIYAFSPDEFIDRVLLEACDCIGVVCGFNYRFGCKAAGTPEDLKARFLNLNNGKFKMVEPIKLDEITVSSSLIKLNLENGSIDLVNKMLGRPFALSHNVVHGKNLGTKLGFPTINYVFSESDAVPNFGIYVTVTNIDGKHYKSVTNVGIRPTVADGENITCETHIIDCDGGCDFYGLRAKVHFLSKIRDEKRFNSMEELSLAIASDVDCAKKFFEDHKECKYLNL
jgi:riboflavin kinase/FMN adenylyltransferase